MNLNWRRRVIWLAILLVLGIALFLGFQPRPRLVDTAEVRSALLQVSVEEEGKTRVIDRYVVSAPVAGTTCRTDLEVGDTVSKDQPLINIRPLQSQALDPRSRAEAESRVAAAEAALQAAEQTAASAAAETELANKELARLRPLAQQGHVSQDSLDQAATRVRSSRALQRSADFAVDVAGHELEAARTALQFTGTEPAVDPTEIVQVRAPVDGKVLKLHQECEGVVERGQPLLEIGDTATLEVETDVLSADAVRIRPGMRVLFERWGGDEPLEGRVRRIEPVGFTKISALGVEEQRVLVISDFISPPRQWRELGDGYRVESRFILWQAEKALQIPASALFRVDGDWAVFVLQDDLAITRRVSIGRRNGLSAQIIQGLSLGERVITHPDKSIEDGSRVKIR
ncbi:MAG: efflux RND transporter periplasmic adaptor subunit [Chromatiales bacterium]|jgi:HlyD family secretion protein